MPHGAAAAADHVLATAPGVYNPSLVLYRSSAWFVARSTRLRWDTTGLKWILNKAQLCQRPGRDLSAMPNCTDFDPWVGRHVECRWGSPTYRPPWEASGVDDTKLFAWPGHGLWAITGRRPAPAKQGEPWCPQPVVWRQYLFQLAPEGRDPEPGKFHSAATDPPNITWAEGGLAGPNHGSAASASQRRLGLRRARRLSHRQDAATPADQGMFAHPAEGSVADWAAVGAGPPLELAISDGKLVYGQRYNVYEKNWMPWVWQGRLLLTYSLAPHKVYELGTDGVALLQHVTAPGDAFSKLGPAAARRLHGGPPVVSVTQHDKLGPHYMGVAHHWVPRGGRGEGRRYCHYLYRQAALPPFQLLQLSAELPLKTNPRYKAVAFASGLAWDDGRSRLLVSYGAGDWESRVLVLTGGEVDQLFDQGPAKPA